MSCPHVQQARVLHPHQLDELELTESRTPTPEPAEQRPSRGLHPMFRQYCKLANLSQNALANEHIQDDPTGLNVCLSCYNGGCTGEQNHGRSHYQLTQHPLALNIRRTRKPKVEVSVEYQLKAGWNLTILSRGTSHHKKCRSCQSKPRQKPIDMILRRLSYVILVKGRWI